MKTKTSTGKATLAEMQEFASFNKGTQRYIRRSLDVGLGRADAVQLWARDALEESSIRTQQRLYLRLDEMRLALPDDSGLDDMEPLMGPLVHLTGFDLASDQLPCFGAYRFLYERLVGPGVRAWLPAAFCAAAALPHLHPKKRGALLTSISEAAATAPSWSNRKPAFFPAWVEKVDLTVTDDQRN